MLTGRRLLIVEDEFLIALAMQGALEAAEASEVVLASNLGEAAGLLQGRPEFDLAIINPPRADGEFATAAQLAAACPALVVCTAAAVDLAGGPLDGAELIIKPFLDDQLLAACRRALERTGKL